MWAKRERLGSSLTTGLKPLPHFRLKAELRRVDIGRTCWVGVPALAGSQRGPSGPGTVGWGRYTGLKPLPHFRLKAGLRRVDSGHIRWHSPDDLGG